MPSTSRRPSLLTATATITDTKVHHLVGHRWFLESDWLSWLSQPDLTDESSMADRKPLVRYGAIKARSRLAPPSYTKHRDVTTLDRS
jgi:hypothetical protein